MKDFLRLSRLENLTDGVYAIAMTLMVLTIEVPLIRKPVTPAKLLGALGSMETQFIIYGVSFYILASLWVNHNQQFVIIRHVDEGFVWINLLGLFLICLLPFSTDLLGMFTGVWVADALFHLQMMAIGLCFYWQTRYAHARGLIADDAAEYRELARERKEGLALPLAALLGLAVTPLVPGYSCFAYLSIPVLMKVLPRIPDKAGAGE